ncbi:MAG: hypothetical protein IJY10_03060 [Lachnospiraceae bacterium]|nr:hypothetical protein [Lachnospiraceae bacterium]
MCYKKQLKNYMKKLMAMVLAGTMLAAPLSADAYIPTNRDTKVAPEKAQYTQEDFEGFTLLKETGTVRFYYRDDRDIFAIEDKQTGYVIKTGADLPFSGDIKDAVKKMKKDKSATTEDILAVAEPYADDLNTTYVGIANSLITVEYYESDKIKYISSASEEGVSSTLSEVDKAAGKYVLDIKFEELDLQMKVYITLEETSLSYHIPAGEIQGTGRAKMAAVDITPFMGASGGRMNVLNPETLDWEEVDNYRTPGYVLVPDGSGSLIRFVDNTAVFNQYVGDVYGKDSATETYQDFMYKDDVPVSDPVMPVFGIAHGDGQMAFVAWAEEGAEYMDIIVNPDGTKATTYTWAYPRFELNVNYFQVYDEKGSGFFTQMDEIFKYDIQMTYSLLFGDGSDGSPAADYTGMARAYRQHLLDSGELTLLADVSEDVPIRLDFILADGEKGILGTNEVVVTTADDVENILNDVMESGISNINTGLIGWQRKGETLTKPTAMRFSWSVGTQGRFKQLMADFAEKGVEISFSRDMLTINKEMLNYYNTATKHISNWYVSINKAYILPANAVTYTFSYATPEKAASWISTLADKVSEYSDGITITKQPNTLTSHYGREGVITTLTETIGLYRETYASLPENLSINLEKPNMYLWKYTDRYLQSPVGSSQFIFETDAVPFLQMVLHGTMEMYAPYANFSFNSQDCVLRMIDYNLSPSFILSQEASWALSDTFSANLYSTEYALYEETIEDIYGQINGVLSQVQGYEWVDRRIPQNGVVINSYEKDGKTIYIIINYTEKEVSYMGQSVAAQSAAVAR